MSAAVPVLTALLLAAFAGILLQRYSPAFTLLLSLGAAVWLLLRLAQPLRGVLQAFVQLGQRTNAQAFSCLLRSAGILLLGRHNGSQSGHAAFPWDLVRLCSFLPLYVIIGSGCACRSHMAGIRSLSAERSFEI